MMSLVDTSLKGLTQRLLRGAGFVWIAIFAFTLGHVLNLVPFAQHSTGAPASDAATWQKVVVWVAAGAFIFHMWWSIWIPLRAMIDAPAVSARLGRLLWQVAYWSAGPALIVFLGFGIACRIEPGVVQFGLMVATMFFMGWFEDKAQAVAKRLVDDITAHTPTDDPDPPAEVRSA